MRDARAGGPWTGAAARLRAALLRRDGKLGTFLGVYTPTVLTILGVILYLRFGWVVGHAGLAGALGIVLLANGITLVTTLALSAIATNSRVGVGGAYFMISRSLGLEIGGAIGVPLFLSQAFSVTLYCFGLAETLRLVWPDVPVPAATLLLVCGVGALAFRGAGVALRAQLPLMGLIALSLLAFAGGALASGSPARLADAVPSGQVGFWTVFAVFFPAVTGVMAGLGLSGDLADPTRSIPRGALAANLTGLGVYLLVPVLLASAATPEQLRGDPLVWTAIAPLGAWLVLPGLWGAIFSSAVGSMLGAPRTLQALALDHVAPERLGRLAGRRQEPRLALLLSLAIALLAVGLGDLNSVAVIVTMFFLTVYGMVNLAAALEGVSGDPSWRPTFPVAWPLALAGALACLAVMLLINVTASVVAVALEIGLWLLLRRRKRQAEWGDVRRGVYEELIRWALVRLEARPMTARSWRPHILVFSDPSPQRLDLVRFGEWFSQERGIVTVCELVVADLLELPEPPREREAEIKALLNEAGSTAFAEVNVVRSVEDGIVDVAQANGMAGIESNTVLLGWPDDPDRLRTLLRAMRRLERLNKSLLLGRAAAGGAPREGERRRVDVWWGGLQRNGDLMLLLAHLLTRNREWRDARIRIRSIASNDLMKAETERSLARLVPAIRIRADVDVIVKPAGESVSDAIRAGSAGADLVLLGLASPAEGQEAAYAERMAELARGLPSFFFVRNNSLFIGDLVSDEPTLPRAPGYS